MLAGGTAARPVHQLGMMRARDVGHRHSSHGRIEVEERFVRDYGSDFRPEAAGPQIFVNDQATAGPANAVQHHVTVPRHQGAQVDDVGTDASAAASQRGTIAPQVTIVIWSPSRVFLARPNGSTLSLPGHGRRAQLSSSIARCSKNSTGSLPRKAAAQQPDCVLGIAGYRDLPAGVVHELDLVGHRVPRVAALEKAAGDAEHHRRSETVGGAPAHGARIVDLLGCGLGIFAELDFRHGHQAGERHADRAADDALPR